MNIITLEQANTIIAAIFEKSRELDLRPMSTVVVEPGNVVKAFGKEDHASALRLEMALGKLMRRWRWAGRPAWFRYAPTNVQCS